MSNKFVQNIPVLDKVRGATAPDENELVQVRRRQARSQETRSKILKAATEIFAEHGFDGSTTRMIAQRASLGHAHVIYHFETKIGVWQAVMRQSVSWFNAAFEERLKGLRGVDEVTTLRLLQADFIRLAAHHPELHWLMSHEAGRQGDRLDWIVDNLVGANFEMFAKLIAAAQAAGRYVSGNPIHLHYLFLGAAARIFMLAVEAEKMMECSPFDTEFIEEHILRCQELFFRNVPE